MARRCIRRKLVRMRGGKMVKRCAKYAGRSTYRRRGRKSSRKPAGMARRGSKCVRFKRVRVKGQGMRRRCASYSGTRKRRTYRRRGRK